MFSGTSNQAALINPRNPRALYFNDSVAVGWVRGSDTLEVAAVDPTQGVILYSLAQKQAERPAFRRDDAYLSDVSPDVGHARCARTGRDERLHHPGRPILVHIGIFRRSSQLVHRALGRLVHHRPTGAISHLGNDIDLARKNRRPTAAHKLDSLTGLFDSRGFISPHSDVVALMTLEHQATMTDLITRTGWEARVSAQTRAVAPATPWARAASTGSETRRPSWSTTCCSWMKRRLTGLSRDPRNLRRSSRVMVRGTSAADRCGSSISSVD